MSDDFFLHFFLKKVEKRESFDCYFFVRDKEVTKKTLRADTHPHPPAAARSIPWDVDTLSAGRQMMALPIQISENA